MNAKATHLHQTVEHLFRHESGKILAVLTRIFGTHNIEIAEDIVQDTLLKAFEIWKFKGLPENPAAWLMKVAKNKALDVIRKEKVRTEFAKDISALLKSEYSIQHTLDKLTTHHEIEDDQLRMMFACCHQELAEEAQIALILKTLCGFSIAEIAKAFLSNEETIQKRLYRARQIFREQKVVFEIPNAEDLTERLDQVLTAIYLIFNEGYNATAHDELIRLDLIEEAMRLAWLLAQNPITQQPKVYALLALMCFHTARFKSRQGEKGDLLLLKEQNRSLWDKNLIHQGNEFLDKAMSSPSVSAFHLEAVIAQEHCVAISYEKTNWGNILQCYDLLLQVKPSAVVALNRAIIVSELYGAASGIEAIENISNIENLKNYYLYYAILGDLFTKTNQQEKAYLHYQKALSLTHSPKEIDFLKGKISKL